MDSLPQPTRSLLLSCSPQRSCKVGGPFQARALSVPAARLSGFFRLDANGISQVSRRFFPFLCPRLRPRSNRCVLAISATSMLPTLCAQRRLRQLLFRGSFTQLRHPLTSASRFVLPLTRKARFRLAGWLAFAGRASNPLDRDERFQLVFTIILLSCPPDASAIKRLRPTAADGVRARAREDGGRRVAPKRQEAGLAGRAPLGAESGAFSKSFTF